MRINPSLELCPCSVHSGGKLLTWMGVCWGLPHRNVEGNREPFPSRIQVVLDDLRVSTKLPVSAGLACGELPSFLAISRLLPVLQILVVTNPRRDSLLLHHTNPRGSHL